MLLYKLSTIFTAIFSFLLGLFVLIQNPKNRMNQLWFFMSICVGLWSSAFGLTITSSLFNSAELFAKTCNVIASFIPSFFVHFCFNLTGIKRHKRTVLFLAYFGNLVIMLSAILNQFCSVKPILNFNYYAFPIGWGYHFYTLHFFLFAIYAEFILLQGIKMADYKKKNQLKYVFLGTTLGYLTGGATFLPVYGIAIEPISAHFIWAYLAIITYAIVKHELLDINIVLRKSAAYSITLFIISALYTVFIFTLIISSKAYLNSSSLWVTILTAVIISASFAPLHNFLSSRVNHAFFHSSPVELAEKNALMIQELQKQDQMKAVATLAAGMAHEIKNPLTSLKTFTEYLPEKSKDPVFMAKFQRIVLSEVRKIDGIVKQLLDFSKPTPPSLAPLDVREPINETLELLSNDLLAKNIHLDRDMKPAQILGDKKQLSQVFLNLFLNAIEAMPQGGTLFIRIEKDGGFSKITIRDTGIGIKKEDLGRLFDPFFTNKPDGTGLGLSIARGIIDEHRGKIEIASTHGQGTELRISLKCN